MSRCIFFASLCHDANQGNFEDVAVFLVQNGADPNDVYTDDKGKQHHLLFDSVTLGNEVQQDFRIIFSVHLSNTFYRSVGFVLGAIQLLCDETTGTWKDERKVLTFRFGARMLMVSNPPLW